MYVRQLILRVRFVVALLCTLRSGHAQGTFVNLNFESATIVPIPGDSYGRIDFASAFPGWTGYVDGVPQTRALYNNLFLDTSGIGLLSNGTLQGNYTAVLQAGVIGIDNHPADTTLAQTGLVPVGTQSLRFRGSLDPPSTAILGVFLSGQRLSLIPVGSGPNYTIYAADISTWAGQTAELDFTVFAQRPHVDNQNVFLDSIQFSTQPIPEPSSFLITSSGALLIWLVLRRGGQPPQLKLHS